MLVQRSGTCCSLTRRQECAFYWISEVCKNIQAPFWHTKVCQAGDDEHKRQWMSSSKLLTAARWGTAKNHYEQLIKFQLNLFFFFKYIASSFFSNSNLCATWNGSVKQLSFGRQTQVVNYPSNKPVNVGFKDECHEFIAECEKNQVEIQRDINQTWPVQNPFKQEEIWCSSRFMCLNMSSLSLGA